MVANIRDQAYRLDRLVTNLLGMVRLESGMMQLNRRLTDPADMVGVALRRLDQALDGRPIQVTVAPDVPAIPVDDQLVEQVLVNVLSNAAKYSPADSPVSIGVSICAGDVAIAVRDWGVGVDPSERELVFEKFYRSPRTSRIPGTGLGLAICRGIAAAHGGTIQAEPAQGRGTLVTLRLPISPTVAVPDEARS